MWVAGNFLAVLIVGGLIGIAHVDAQTRTCPLTSGGACDQWHLEQTDKELASVVANAVVQIGSFAHPDTRNEAKDKLQQAQRLWMQLREIECQAESAFMWMRSARTRQGYTATCMDTLTRQRIAELKKRYLLRD